MSLTQPSPDCPPAQELPTVVLAHSQVGSQASSAEAHHPHSGTGQEYLVPRSALIPQHI